METGSKKRSATTNSDNHHSNLINQTKKKKITSSLSSNVDESPVTGIRITEWEEFEKWKEVRGDIEPTMNYVEITPEAVEELRKIKNVIGDYICQLCKVKYENAFALAMHKCPRVVHIEFRYEQRFQNPTKFLNISFSCPECDKTFNCPANLASHRRWHKPQTLLSCNESIPSPPAVPKPTINKHQRCSSSSDSHSTKTSSSTISEIAHESSTLSSSSSTDARKKDFSTSHGTQKKAPDHGLRATYNRNSQRMLPAPFQPFSTSYMKQSLIFPHHRSLTTSIPSSFDFRRLQSSCIFCHEQFSELNYLLQHIRKNHAVPANTNTKHTTLTLDKIAF